MFEFEFIRCVLIFRHSSETPAARSAHLFCVLVGDLILWRSPAQSVSKIKTEMKKKKQKIRTLANYSENSAKTLMGLLSFIFLSVFFFVLFFTFDDACSIKIYSNRTNVFFLSFIIILFFSVSFRANKHTHLRDNLSVK